MCNPFGGNGTTIDAAATPSEPTTSLPGADGSELLVDDRTVKGTLDQMLRYQGGFLEGDSEAALDRLALTIYQMVVQVSRGDTIAEAPCRLL